MSDKNVGNQTHIEARFDCLDPVVLKLLAECRGFGVNKYGETSHQQIPVYDHLNHAINHINEHRRGDQSELHLVNAMCRLMFAIHGLHSQGNYVDEYWHPDMQKQLREIVEANVSSVASQYVRNADPIPVVGINNG